jgi:hypothetical protein
MVSSVQPYSNGSGVKNNFLSGCEYILLKSTELANIPSELSKISGVLCLYVVRKIQFWTVPLELPTEVMVCVKFDKQSVAYVWW